MISGSWLLTWKIFSSNQDSKVGHSKDHGDCLLHSSTTFSSLPCKIHVRVGVPQQTKQWYLQQIRRKMNGQKPVRDHATNVLGNSIA